MTKKIGWGFISLLIFLTGCSSVQKVEKGDMFAEGCYLQEKVPEFQSREATHYDYFSRVKDSSHKLKNLDRCNEKQHLELYKNKSIPGAGESSQYWRWDVEFSHSEMESLLNENLYDLKKNRRTSVYKLIDKKWSLDSFEKNPIGKLQKVSVLRRGVSGIATELLIKGSRGTYIVTKEYNIRKVLGFSKSSRIGEREIHINGKNGKSLGKNMSLLPSGFFAIEEKKGKIHIYGGGFGHGVGLPQWTAKDLANSHSYDYRDILKRYYPNTSLTSASKNVKNSDALLVLIGQQGNLEQREIKISSISGLTLKDSRKTVKVPGGKTADFQIANGKITVKSEGKILFETSEEIEIDSKEKIRVNSSIRNGLKTKNPLYYGSFTVRPYEKNRMLLINRVSLEDYLKGVVPSEMPQSFGLEALKAQAISSRTYAVNAVLGDKYKKYGVNLVDSTASQVYNNLDEGEITNRAIKETRGKILTHNGKPITTYFYSTSSGHSAVPGEVW